MSPFVIAASYWLHSLATVVFIGHYVLLALIYLPAWSNDKAEGPVGVMLSEFSKSSRLWLYASLFVFAVTGVYLTLVDSNYRGIGNFSSPWAVMMLLKHIVIMGMVAAGFWYNAILRVGPLLSAKTGGEQAFNRFRSHVNGMAVAGVVVLLLTAFSQIQ